MRQLGLLVLLSLLLLPAHAAAQVPDCQTPTGVVKVIQGQMVTRPSTFSSGATVSVQLSNGTSPENAVLRNVGADWTAENLAQIRALVGANEAFLVWSQLGQPSCRYRFVAITNEVATNPTSSERVTPPGRLSPSATGRLYRADECTIAGQEWVGQMVTGTRQASVLLFDEAGTLCFPPPVRPRQGDPIYVGLFTNNPGWSASRVTFQPCLLESASPNVLASGRLSDFTRLESEGPTHRVLAFPVRYCWNSPVAIEISSADGTGRINYALEQVTLYRATLHIGTIFTENHEVTFGLRPDGAASRIFAQGPIDRGPEYVAALVFYSLPRYFSRRGFHGRDPVADTGWKDRFGGVVGVGLRNPTKRFVTGLSLEVAAGVNVIGVWDWVETRTLRDVKEGDVFTGTVADIPTQREWREKFVLGVTLDLVYASTAFRR